MANHTLEQRPSVQLIRRLAQVCAVAWLSTTAVPPGTAVAAEAYRPASDAQVLETLPKAWRSARRGVMAVARAASAAPRDAALAGRLARSYIGLGNASGDPRFYGRAQAAIAPWWQATDPPPAILALRAKLKEKDHQYAAALDDLRALAQRTPEDAQAWLELANIERVLGRYAASARACEQMAAASGEAAAPLCRIPLLALTGRVHEAAQMLDTFAPVARSRWPATATWLRTMQAEIARARGQHVLAEQHYRKGLAENEGATYLLRAYADFLLDAGRAQEALALAADHTADNGALLRAAVAARRAGNSKLARSFSEELARRFDALRSRGGQPHARFEARYALELADEPQRALTIALTNWEQQKELRDTRNVLEAALAAANPGAAAVVLDFLAANGTEDVALDALRQRILAARDPAGFEHDRLRTQTE